MYPLKKALAEHELIVLRVIGEWWEQDLTGVDKAACVQQLAETLAALDMELETSYLPPEEAAALQTLVQNGGRMTVPTFQRQHGEVRLMGPGRLEREEPWFDPISPAEALWYRGFLYRAFDETDSDELTEFFYLPDELNSQLLPAPVPAASTDTVALPPAAPPAQFTPQVTNAVDDLTTMLAAGQIQPLRRDNLAEIQPFLLTPHPARAEMLLTLGVEMKLFRKSEAGLRPTRTAVGWLRQNRPAQLRSLAEAWSSSHWNDLQQVPDIRCEGSGWHNDPILARTALFDALPRTTDWFAIDTIVDHLYQNDPDFQRPDGNYDTWYIRDLEQNIYISGFENWRLVEGRLLHFLLEGPLVWLGMVETGPPAENDSSLYRLTHSGLDWLTDQPLPNGELEAPISIRDDGTILVPVNANRYYRFQVARISEAIPVEPQQPFAYYLTPGSLSRARTQGIEPERVIEFLEKVSERPLPAGPRRAIERWTERGPEGRLTQVVVLRVRDAEILNTLRNNPKTRDLIAEPLGDLAAAVQPEHWPRLRQAAARLGLLLDIDL